MSIKNYKPKAIFETLKNVIIQYKDLQNISNPDEEISKWLTFCLEETLFPNFALKDYKLGLSFLYSYRGSADTFASYRRDLERFIQWSWFVRGQSILDHRREEIEDFVEFCQKPPKRWIGFKKVPRFKRTNGRKTPNSEWTPFEAHLSKIDHKKGIERNKEKYQFSQQAMKAMFGVLGSFYKYLLQEEVTQVNPIALLRQKSKFIQKQDVAPMIRRLSNHQWEIVLNLTKEKAEMDVKYERDVFILSCLYGMYLRISELVAHERWSPTMGDFFKDSDDNWWFKTVGKGNKQRRIAVSNAMLEALKRYRAQYLNITPLPTLNEKTPLIGHSKNSKLSMVGTRPIRALVQECFDTAADKLEEDNKMEEANGLRVATVHWLRHTGISEDVKTRPREHVRDDAGHSSSAITDKYIDIELKERAKSAHNKRL